ncbi:uncharacterized protein G2W53_010391 [Senna tora]|uniref:Uncharacterized protein n=1 Tax=Senna tora TaxID=362788 RepID=A0A835CE05_9FABA|nr:uncharacterized protein G2W53_010391 [Senna tora]
MGEIAMLGLVGMGEWVKGWKEIGVGLREGGFSFGEGWKGGLGSRFGREWVKGGEWFGFGIGRRLGWVRRIEKRGRKGRLGFGFGSARFGGGRREGLTVFGLRGGRREKGWKVGFGFGVGRGLRFGEGMNEDG